MAAAWAQIGDVIAANNRLRQAQLAARTSLTWFAQLGGTASASEVVTLTAPAHRRIVSDGVSVRYRVRESAVREATLSTAMRRIVRPAGPAGDGLRPRPGTADGPDRRPDQ